MLCLFARKTKGIKSLVDYRQSHIIISKEYANVLQNKTMDKEIKKIRAQKKKEKDNKRTKHIAYSLTVNGKKTQRLANKHARTNFNLSI
jgi:aminoglycoside N3'-acetyltransferase